MGMVHRCYPAALFALLLLQGGCGAGTNTSRPQPAVETLLPRVVVEPVELLQAAAAPPEDQALDVGLVVFDPGLPEDENRGRELGIFPEVRNAEARFLPYALREVLVESQQWGAVRVLPDPDVSSTLMVRGKILKSDGVRLNVEIRADDASGRNWLHRVYQASNVEQPNSIDSLLAADERPFLDLFHRIANDLLVVRTTLDDRQLREIAEVSFLRYASDLAPEAFAGYLLPTPGGGYTYQRLPSAEDPMVQRIKRVRAQEFLFIDTMDDQYFELYSAMEPTYELWRQYNREQVIYQEAKEQRLSERDIQKKGSFPAMKDSYNRYRWAKIQQQELQELAEGFENEVAPTAVDLEGRVVELNGSLEERYLEWRRILRKIYELETGPVPSGKSGT